MQDSRRRYCSFATALQGGIGILNCNTRTTPRERPQRDRNPMNYLVLSDRARQLLSTLKQPWRKNHGSIDTGSRFQVKHMTVAAPLCPTPNPKWHDAR